MFSWLVFNKIILLIYEHFFDIVFFDILLEGFLTQLQDFWESVGLDNSFDDL